MFIIIEKICIFQLDLYNCYVFIFTMKGLRGTKITLIWYVYVKENISLSLLTTKYIASNCCTFSDIDFWFDQHCKVPEAAAYTQRNLCIPNLLHLTWRSFSCFLFHQRSKSAFLKMSESLVLCINRLYQMYWNMYIKLAF